MTPNEYRKKHKRCATCEYHIAKSYGFHQGICDVKQKTTKATSGKFCRVYKAREFKR